MEIYKRLQNNVDHYEEVYAEEDLEEVPVNKRAKYSPQRVHLHAELAELKKINALTLSQFYFKVIVRRNISEVGDLQMQIRMLRSIQNDMDVDQGKYPRSLGGGARPP